MESSLRLIFGYVKYNMPKPGGIYGLFAQEVGETQAGEVYVKFAFIQIAETKPKGLEMPDKRLLVPAR